MVLDIAEIRAGVWWDVFSRQDASWPKQQNRRRDDPNRDIEGPLMSKWLSLTAVISHSSGA